MLVAMRCVLALLALTACGPPPAFVSARGVEWRWCPPAGCPTPAEVAEVEDAAVGIVAGVDPDCLRGVEVEPQAEAIYACDPPGNLCRGQVVDRRTITLGKSSSLAISSYLHELVHVLIYCRDDDADRGHSRPEWAAVDAWYAAR
jgi:hypothetical protein